MDILLLLYDQQFGRLHRRSIELIEATPAEKLYWKPRESREGLPSYSCGEHVLRSAGVVEQTFGGITANLWDDPFEWTLPETLSSQKSIVNYLREVDETRRRGFEFFRGDGDLGKEIVVPSGEKQTIQLLLMDTLVRVAHHQGCAIATFRLFSDKTIPWG